MDRRRRLSGEFECADLVELGTACAHLHSSYASAERKAGVG
jgi:hypothetical protein